MKKILALILVFVTVLPLTGCDLELLEDLAPKESEELVLIVQGELKYNVSEADFYNEETGECIPVTEFYAVDVNNAVYQVLCNQPVEILVHSVVVVKHNGIREIVDIEEKKNIRADYTVEAVSMDYADDELAAKTVLNKEYGASDLSRFKVTTETNDDGSRSLKYDLFYGEYESWMNYRVTVGEKGRIYRHSVVGEQYGRYIDCVSDESIALAETKLRESGGEKFYLMIDYYGYLCLGWEEIVDTPDGSGDCIDHDHVFHTERISDKAFKDEK